jgi:uncharacterized membrane protein YeiH
MRRVGGGEAKGGGVIRDAMIGTIPGVIRPLSQQRAGRHLRSVLGNVVEFRGVSSSV